MYIFRARRYLARPADYINYLQSTTATTSTYSLGETDRVTVQLIADLKMGEKIRTFCHPLKSA